MPGWNKNNYPGGSGLRVGSPKTRARVFSTIPAARRSLCTEGGSVEYAGKHVVVATPSGVGTFSAEEWGRAEAAEEAAEGEGEESARGR